MKAFVVRKPGSSVAEDVIIGYCRERLAPYKVPRSVEFTTELPRSLAGKVLRLMLRAKELQAKEAGVRREGGDHQRNQALRNWQSVGVDSCRPRGGVDSVDS